MKRKFLTLFFFTLSSLLFLPTPSFSSEKDDISLIRQQVAEMKAQYENQIKALEEQVKVLQTQVAYNTSAVRGAQVAQMVDKGYGAIVGYSTESIKADLSEKTEPLGDVWHGDVPDKDHPAIKTPEPEPLHPDAREALMKSGEPFFDRLPSYLTKGFEFHGYMRAGFGANDKGGQQIAFRAPGAPAKYRLGNETESYGELAFVNRYNPDKVGGPSFNTQIRVGYNTPELMDDDPINDRLNMREAFCQATNLGWSSSPDISFWAGERFYRRLDIHINDFYIYDMSGYGGGFEELNVPFGDAKLAVAYIGGSSDNYQFPKAGRVAKNTVDMRLYNLDVPWGKGTLWAAPSGVTSGIYTDTSGNQVTYPTSGGMAVGFIHMHDISPIGYNQITGQYGFGTGSDFSPNIQNPTPKLRDSWKFRITESNVVQVNDHLSIMSDFIYQASDAGQTGPAKLTWISGGFRPVYYFNKCVAVALENGIDYIDNQLDQYSGMLYKVTLAPMIKIDNTFFGRPEIRGYVTYAAWTDGFKGRVASTAFDGSQAGLSAGVQCESWW
ncbi:MAG TPA: carbohydrate porin [Candidatus Omnitrophota bacterium]|nr:carbohydrate porin [Candidatus Omnitrophota bacterium]